MSTYFSIIKGKFHSLKDKIYNNLNSLKYFIKNLPPKLWTYFYIIKQYFLLFKFKYQFHIFSFLIISLLIFTVFTANKFEDFLNSKFLENDNLDILPTLFFTLGGSLVGATAIAFTLVMFAMQVNLQRMPHGLFRKFSADAKLIISFFLTFIFAIIIILLPIFINTFHLSSVFLIAFWSTIFIFILFLVSYKRALSLINPQKQIEMIVSDVEKQFQNILKYLKKIEPIQKNNAENNLTQSKKHLLRNTFFNNFPRWTAHAEKGIDYCTNYAKRFVEYGDNEVSNIALNAVVKINQEYVKTKGKTFFSHNVFIDSNLSTDDFINKTLENLRKILRTGITSGNEEQIVNIFRTYQALALVYLDIEYVDGNPSKHHTILATGYLENGINDILIHNMPDVQMEGVRLMGELVQHMLMRGETLDISLICEKIESISTICLFLEKNRPVTLIGVEQISSITIALLNSKLDDIKLIARKLRDSITNITKQLLNLDEKLFELHGSSIGPYYAITNIESLHYKLINSDIVNKLLRNDNDESVKRIISHFEQWSDRIFLNEKENLLLAIQKRSHLTSHLLEWIVNITKLLISFSDLDACDDKSGEKLETNALWLISILSHIPDEKDSLTFVVPFHIEDKLFDVAEYSHSIGNNEFTQEVNKLLLDWAFKAGKFDKGYGTFEQAIYGLVTMDVLMGNDGEELKSNIQEKLKQTGQPNSLIRSRTSCDIREKLNPNFYYSYPFELIEMKMQEIDKTSTNERLNSIADILIQDIE